MTKNAFHAQFCGVIGVHVYDGPKITREELKEAEQSITKAIDEAIKPIDISEEGEDWKKADDGC